MHHACFNLNLPFPFFMTISTVPVNRFLIFHCLLVCSSTISTQRSIRLSLRLLFYSAVIIIRLLLSVINMYVCLYFKGAWNLSYYSFSIFIFIMILCSKKYTAKELNLLAPTSSSSSVHITPSLSLPIITKLHFNSLLYILFLTSFLRN